MNTEEKLNYVYKIGDEGLVNEAEGLIDMLQEERETIVKEAIADVLKKVRSKRFIEKIGKLFYSDDLYLRNVATEILAAYEEDAIPYLSKILDKEENEHVRKLALDTLYMIQEPYVIDVIAKALNDPAKNNLTSAIEYIGNLGGTKYASKIADILKGTDDPFLIVTCLSALSEIGNEETAKVVKEKFPNPLELDDFIFPAYVRAIIKQTTIDNLYFVLELVKEKGEIFYKEIIDMVEGIVSVKEDMSSEDRKKIYNALVELLEYQIPSMNKYEILNLMGDLGYKEAGEYIYKLLDSEDPFIKMGAIEALGKLSIKDKKVIDKLRDILEHEENEDVKAVAEEILENLTEV